MSRAGAANSFFGRKHNLSARTAMREARRRRPAAMKGRSFGPNPKIAAARRREWAQLDEMARRARIAPFVRAGLETNRRSSGTHIELEVARLLQIHPSPVRRNVSVGLRNVDLLVGDTVVVECFGDYWHCNPFLYDPDWLNRSLGCTAAAKWGKDAARANALVAAGYAVFVLWEYDLKHRPSVVRAIIERVISETARRHRDLRQPG